MKICEPLAQMIFRQRSQVPSLLSWLQEQDAESIAAGSANQSAEARNAQRRSAATEPGTKLPQQRHLPPAANRQKRKGANVI